MKTFEDLSKEYSGDGDKSYLVITVPVTEEVKQYQIGMLENNKLELLLPMSLQRINNDMKFYYELTSKIPLNKILKRRPMNVDEFEHILSQIEKLTRQLKDYLLDTSSVILDTACIYCEPATLSLYFLYFPIQMGVEEPNRLKSFLKHLVIEEIHLQDDASGMLLRRVLEALKSESFSIETLYECLRASQQKEWIVPAQPAVKLQSKPHRTTHVMEKEAERKEKVNIPGTSRNKVKEENTALYESKKDSLQQVPFLQLYPRSSYIITAAANVAMLAGIISILLCSEKENAATNALGSLIIFGAINYFLFTRLFSKEKRAPAPKSMAEGKPSVPLKRYENTELYKKIPFAEPKRTSLPRANPINDAFTEASVTPQIITSEIKQGTPEHFRFNCPVSDKTMVLHEPCEENAYLQSNTSATDKIRLNKKAILIGRLSGTVDHIIQNSAVGKIHAEIVQKEEGYYIIDLNSVNGTFVNGERVICNIETPIHNGDIIALANAVYTFRACS